LSWSIPAHFPDIDLGLLHLGGTRVMGVLLTMDGRQGVEAMRIVAPDLAVPIHYDDYDIFTSPLDDFRREVSSAGLEDRVRYVGAVRRFVSPGQRARGRPCGTAHIDRRAQAYQDLLTRECVDRYLNRPRCLWPDAAP
jgi:hypothetical protein